MAKPHNVINVGLSSDDLCRLPDHSAEETEVQEILNEVEFIALKERLGVLQETYQNALNTQSLDGNPLSQYVYVGPLFQVSNPRSDSERLFIPLILNEGHFYDRDFLYGRIFPLDYSALIVDNRKLRTSRDIGVGMQLDALLSVQKTSEVTPKYKPGDLYKKYEDLFATVQKSLSNFGIETKLIE